MRKLLFKNDIATYSYILSLYCADREEVCQRGQDPLHPAT